MVIKRIGRRIESLAQPFDRDSESEPIIRSIHSATCLILKTKFSILTGGVFNGVTGEAKPPGILKLRHRRLCALSPTRPLETALDLGCGTGTNAITLARHGWKVSGVDFIGAAIKKSPQKKAAAEGLDITFIESSVTDLDMFSGPFTYILDIGCLFGLVEADRPKYAANVRRMLAAGGWYMLYAWNPRYYNNKMVGISPDAVDDLLGDTLTKFQTIVGEEHGAASTWYWYQRPNPRGQGVEDSRVRVKD